MPDLARTSQVLPFPGRRTTLSDRVFGGARGHCDIEADTGQVSTGVKIMLQMSHNTLTSIEEYVQ